MIRLKAYTECFNCIWFSNPDKCNEYATCKDCPNSIDGNCICCEQIPENEENCPYFKEKQKTTKQEQIDEMAKIIDDRLIEANLWLGSMNKGKGYWIAEKLVEHYQPKLPEDSVVLSREEYEMLANKYKNLEIKYSNLCDNYRLCKDANETLKQNVITTRKKTVKEILQEIRGYYPIDKKHCNDSELFILNLCEDIASRYGVKVLE